MRISIAQWFEEHSISSRVQEQILQKGITEVISPEEKRMPLTMISSDGTHYLAFLIQQDTSEYAIERCVRWIEAHLDAIKSNKEPFFIIQDTKTIRFDKTFFELGLTDYIISKSRPKLYKRDDLIRKLQQIADKIPKLELPWTVEKICVFGSILRGSEKVHDIDVYLQCSKSKMQEKRRKVIYSALSDRNNVSLKQILKILNGERRSINKLVDENGDLRTALTAIDYPLAWFKCLTWSYIETWASRGTITVALAPNEDIIMRKLLVGNLKGFKDFFINKSLVAKNLVLAWSPEKPNVKENIDNRSEDEQMDYLWKELEDLITDTDLYHEKFSEILDEETQKGLATERPKIERTEGETKEDLIQKIEIMRAYIKKLNYKWPNIQLR